MQTAPIKPMKPWFQTVEDIGPQLDWTEFFGNDQPVELDIGCGRGLFLFNAAVTTPGTNFLGLEIDYREGRRTATRLMKRDLPNARVIGVEPAGAPKLSRAREAGTPVRLDKTSSIADGLLAVEIGHLPFAHHQRYIDDVVLVDDAAMRKAMRALLDGHRAKAQSELEACIACSVGGEYPRRLAEAALRSPALKP